MTPAVPDPAITLTPPLCSIFRRFLKRQGLKFTPERAEILEAVLRKPGIFEAEELLAEMRQAGLRASKATVYRTLKHLLDAGIISEVLIDSERARYQLTFGQTPKGRLVCVETDQIIEFENPALTALRDRICKQYGFEPLSFQFTIYGTSPQGRAAVEKASKD
ncbi:MAG: transcriptional repressor [Phycisphaeraceae bacterium]|nr:transcriptional repressor [Phycisphaeraceae bacterium]